MKTINSLSKVDTDIETMQEIVVSTEDDLEIRRITIVNNSDKDAKVEDINITKLTEEQERERRANENRILVDSKIKIKLNSKEYSWIKVLYPACLTEDRKVLFRKNESNSL